MPDTGQAAPLWAGRAIPQVEICCSGLQDIKFNVHAHPTLSEVLDELFKAAHVEAKAPGKVPLLIALPPYLCCRLPWQDRMTLLYISSGTIAAGSVHCSMQG